MQKYNCVIDGTEHEIEAGSRAEAAAKAFRKWECANPRSYFANQDPTRPFVLVEGVRLHHPGNPVHGEPCFALNIMTGEFFETVG